MVKAGGVNPGRIAQQTPNLQQKEAQTLQQQQKQKVSTTDAQRIAQQAGFTKAARKKKSAIDIGDSSKAPIPLPDDDIDPDVWSNERLDAAQQNMGMASAQLEDVAESDESDVDIAGTVTAGTFLPTEEGVSRMEKLAAREAPDPVPMEEVSSDVEKLFNIKFDRDVPVGHRVLATGLVVAGEAGAVDVEKDGINEKKLAGGLKKVTERGNQAVGQAQKMNKGIDRELNVQRTFVFKR